MNTKINIVNDKFTKISPMAFGSLFSNLSEYVVDETPEKTFKNIGVFVGKKIVKLVNNQSDIYGLFQNIIWKYCDKM